MRALLFLGGLTECWRRGPCAPRGCGRNQDTCRALHQLLRDLLTNASCRCDVYARDLDQLWPLETRQALSEIQFLRRAVDHFERHTLPRLQTLGAVA